MNRQNENVKCPACKCEFVTSAEAEKTKCPACDFEFELETNKICGKYEELLGLVKDMMEHINTDIFYKTPRGQTSKGQIIRWHRCTELLAVADKINEHIDEYQSQKGEPNEQRSD
jgi:transposase-like protein